MKLVAGREIREQRQPGGSGQKMQATGESRSKAARRVREAREEDRLEMQWEKEGHSVLEEQLPAKQERVTRAEAASEVEVTTTCSVGIL